MLRGDIVKDDSGSDAVFTEQGSSASQMTDSKSHGYHIQTARVRMNKQQTQYQLIPRKYGGCSEIAENSQIGRSRSFGFVYHDTNGLNHGPVWKTQSFFLSGILYGHPLAGLLWEGQFEKVLLKYGLGEGFQLGMLIRTP